MPQCCFVLCKLEGSVRPGIGKCACSVDVAKLIYQSCEVTSAGPSFRKIYSESCLALNWMLRKMILRTLVLDSGLWMVIVDSQGVPLSQNTRCIDFTVKGTFLLSKTKSLLQPKFQGVIAIFEAYYISKTFTKLDVEKCGQDGQNAELVERFRHNESQLEYARFLSWRVTNVCERYWATIVLEYLTGI
jgi:hypothetical protein